MTEPVLLADRPAPGTVRLRLNRPERRNAVDRAVVEALAAALEEHQESVVVLDAVGPVFCAGADLSLDDAERAEVSDLLYRLYAQMVAAPLPIVAAIAGPAVGGGAQLAVASDLRVAGPAARLRFPGPGHGLAVGAWALPALVGRGRALDLCLTMRDVGAEEALAIGLVDRVADDPGAVAVEMAAQIAALKLDAVRRVKRVVTVAADRVTALELEAHENAASWSGSTEGLTR